MCSKNIIYFNIFYYYIIIIVFLSLLHATSFVNRSLWAQVVKLAALSEASHLNSTMRDNSISNSIFKETSGNTSLIARVYNPRCSERLPTMSLLPTDGLSQIRLVAAFYLRRSEANPTGVHCPCRRNRPFSQLQ